MIHLVILIACCIDSPAWKNPRQVDDQKISVSDSDQFKDGGIAGITPEKLAYIREWLSQTTEDDPGGAAYHDNFGNTWTMSQSGSTLCSMEPDGIHGTCITR